MKTKPRPLLAIYDADGKSTVRLLATARRQMIAAARVLDMLDQTLGEADERQCGFLAAELRKLVRTDASESVGPRPRALSAALPRVGADSRSRALPPTDR